MASGLPVVTTDDPAYAGSIVSGQVVLAERRADAFRRAIQDLLADPGALRAIGTRGRELAARHFDWHANFGRMLTIYSGTRMRESVA